MRPAISFFLILSLALGARTPEAFAAANAPVCVDGINRLFGQVTGRSPMREEKDDRSAGYLFLKRLEGMVERDEDSAQGARVILKLPSKPKPAPLEEGPEGSTVVYHSGGHEEAGTAHQTQDFEALRGRLRTAALEIANEGEGKASKIKFFESNIEKDTPEGIREFIEKGRRLSVSREKLKDSPSAARRRWNAWCIALPAFGGALSPFVFGDMRRPSSKIDREIMDRVVATTVINRQGHIKQLREVLADNPEGETWIKEHEIQLNKFANLASYYNRFIDYEPLRDIKTKEEFQTKAFKMAMDTPMTSADRAFFLDGSTRIVELEAQSAKTDSNGMLQRHRILTVDELRERARRQDGALHDAFVNYATVAAGIATGAALGAVGCKRLQAMRNAKKSREPLPAFAKFSQVLSDVTNPTASPKGFTKEVVWMDSRTPDGTYSAALLEVFRIGTVPKVKLTMVSYQRPPIKEVVPQPAEPTSYFVRRKEVKPEAPAVDFDILQRELITHRWASIVGEEFAPHGQEIDKHFAKAREMKLTPLEFSDFAKAVRSVEEFRDIRRMDYALRDITKERERKAAEEEEARQRELASMRRNAPREQVYVPVVSDFRSPERVVKRLRFLLDFANFKTNKERKTIILAAPHELPERHEVEDAIEDLFNIAAGMQLSPRELQSLKTEIEIIREDLQIASLETVERTLRKELQYIVRIRRLNHDPGPRPNIPEPWWPQFVYVSPFNNGRGLGGGMGNAFGGF